MKRATRGTRTLGWALAISAAAAVAASGIGVIESQGGNGKLAIVVGELRARASEATLLARAADVSTDTYLRMQAAQLGQRIEDARNELGAVKGGDDGVKRASGAQAQALVDAVRALQALPAKDDAARLQGELDAIAKMLLALERSIS